MKIEALVFNNGKVEWENSVIESYDADFALTVDGNVMDGTAFYSMEAGDVGLGWNDISMMAANPAVRHFLSDIVMAAFGQHVRLHVQIEPVDDLAGIVREVEEESTPESDDDIAETPYSPTEITIAAARVYGVIDRPPREWRMVLPKMPQEAYTIKASQISEILEREERTIKTGLLMAGLKRLQEDGLIARDCNAYYAVAGFGIDNLANKEN